MTWRTWCRPVRNDLELYDRYAEQWWDGDAPAFRSLRSVNEFRQQLLWQWLGEHWQGRCVVDLGCGGGLLSQPLVQRGARVVGVDLSFKSLRVAAAQSGSANSCYLCGDITRSPVASASAEGVLLADVLEHIPDHHQALAEAARIVRASGWVYVNTINRTLRAHLLAVLLAEGVGLIPRGTHDPKLFLRPEELRRSAERLGLRLEQVCGEAPVLWQTLRTWTLRLRPSNSLALGYSALLRKASRRAR